VPNASTSAAFHGKRIQANNKALRASSRRRCGVSRRVEGQCCAANAGA